MGESFVLEVLYEGKKIELPCELRVYGYTHKIAITIEESEIVFEPDEERNYRAIVPEHISTSVKPALLQAIAAELHAAFT